MEGTSQGKIYRVAISLLVVIGQNAALFLLTTFVVFAALYSTPGGRGPDRILAIGERTGSEDSIQVRALEALDYKLTWVAGYKEAHTWLRGQADIVEQRRVGIQTRVQLVLLFGSAKGDGAAAGVRDLLASRPSLRDLPVIRGDTGLISTARYSAVDLPTAVQEKALPKRQLVSGYWSWLINFPGYSETGAPIGGILWDAAGRTLLLVGGSLAVALVIALGMVALEHQFPDSRWVKAGFYTVNLLSGIHILILSLLFVVITSISGRFSVAMLLILAFGNGTLSDYVTALRQEAARISSQDYLLAAQGRGGSRLRHARREITISLIESTISRIPTLVGGTIVLEYVCAYFGLGYYIVDAIGSRPRDVTMAMDITTVIVGFVIVGNLVGDVLRVHFDPRVT